MKYCPYTLTFGVRRLSSRQKKMRWTSEHMNIQNHGLKSTFIRRMTFITHQNYVLLSCWPCHQENDKDLKKCLVQVL